MRGKLQNFAKAAILAIAQQNYSIDDALAGTPVCGPDSESPRSPRGGDLLVDIKSSFVNICVVRSHYLMTSSIFALFITSNLIKTLVKCLLDETP
jgi:hypothetical protein